MSINLITSCLGVHEPVLRVPVHVRDGAEDVRAGALRLHGLSLQQVTVRSQVRVPSALHCKDSVPKIGKIFPERKLRGLSPNFYFHISSERLMYFHDRSAYFAAAK
jgi:hypothetical protein